MGKKDCWAGLLLLPMETILTGALQTPSKECSHLHSWVLGGSSPTAGSVHL